MNASVFSYCCADFMFCNTWPCFSLRYGRAAELPVHCRARTSPAPVAAIASLKWQGAGRAFLITLTYGASDFSRAICFLRTGFKMDMALLPLLAVLLHCLRRGA